VDTPSPIFQNLRRNPSGTAVGRLATTARLALAQTAAWPPASLMTAPFLYVEKRGCDPSSGYSSFSALRAPPLRHRKFFVPEVGGKFEAVATGCFRPHLGSAKVSPATRLLSEASATSTGRISGRWSLNTHISSQSAPSSANKVHTYLLHYLDIF
jgi:hypothetical protein